MVIAALEHPRLLLLTAVLEGARLLLTATLLHRVRLLLVTALVEHAGLPLRLTLMSGVRLLAAAHLERAGLALLAPLALHRLARHRKMRPSVLHVDPLASLHARGREGMAAAVRPRRCEGVAATAVTRPGRGKAVTATMAATAPVRGVLTAAAVGRVLTAATVAVGSGRGGRCNGERGNAGNEHDLRHEKSPSEGLNGSLWASFRRRSVRRVSLPR